MDIRLHRSPPLIPALATSREIRKFFLVVVLLVQVGPAAFYGTLPSMVGRVGGAVSNGTPFSSSSGSFGIGSLPSSLFFPVGSSSPTQVDLTSINGFAGTVSLAAAVSNGTLANRPTVIIDNSTLQLISGGVNSTIMTVYSTTSTPSGFYTVTVTGTSGTLTNSTLVMVGVQDFFMSASPSSLTLAEGYSATSTITLTGRGGFNGNVSLSPAIFPSGPTVSLSRSSLHVSTGSSSCILTISVSSSTPVGSYTVNVTGSFGPLAHFVLVGVSVNGFTFAASTNGFSMAAGSSASPTITVNSANGFAGTISLGVSVFPSGPSSSLNVSSVTLTSGSSAGVVLVISTTPSIPPGFYTANVTGTSGLQVHSLFIPVAIGSITVSINSAANFTGFTVKTTGSLSV